MKRRFFLTAAGAALGLMAFSGAQAQFGGLGRIVNSVASEVKLPNFLSGPQPVSTSIRDATFGDASRDGFAPGNAQNLLSLRRADNGGFVLAAGFYSMSAQSYCLHAGTHGPGQGQGYLYAPLKGSAQDAIQSILQNSVSHPQISQQDIQALLWAIVARAKFEDLNNNLKVVAGQLLTPKQLASLNRNALSVLTSNELSGLTGGLPGPIRAVAEAESKLRGMLTSGTSSFQDMEAVAILAGVVPVGEGSLEIPASRWSKHPDGYWLRFRPSGYSRTDVDVFVEERSSAVGKVYDPAKSIAVPVNTARQRLGQSGRAYTS